MNADIGWGHGWVTPRSDGSRTKCGGPLLCQACYRERLAVEREQQRELGRWSAQGEPRASPSQAESQPKGSRVLMVCHCLDGGGDAHVHA